MSLPPAGSSEGSSRPAVVLLSGGLDSTTCLAIARSEGFAPVALSFRYGQRQIVELDCARRVAAEAGVEHVTVDIDLAAFGGSALVDPLLDVPKHDDVADVADIAGTDLAGTADSDRTDIAGTPERVDIAAGGEAVRSDRHVGAVPGTGEIPITYVPARNTIFLAFALAVAEVRGALDLFIGVNAVDYSGYPDCRPAFVEAFEAMANLATRAGVEGRRLTIHTPLIALTKAEIIQWGRRLGVDYAGTSTCYDPGPDGGACARCDACLLRSRGFADAGLPDPTRYAVEQS